MIDDNTRDLFVGVNPAGANPVIVVVHPDGSQAVLATFPSGTLINGITPDFFGNLYVADSFLGYVWRVSSLGGTPEIWLNMHAPVGVRVVARDRAPPIVRSVERPPPRPCKRSPFTQ